MAYILWLKYL